MKLFATAKPRRYQHVLIYADERRDRLAALEARIRHQLGLPPKEENDKEKGKENEQ
ncbi:MAG: hypothetical protein IJ710_01935 [Prevotella sp.]|nr:hypothetical protein [Prevotella sp.]